MVFTDLTLEYFSLIPFRVRSAIAESQSYFPFAYEDELFFKSYNALHNIWVKRQPQRRVANSLGVSKETLKKWEDNFITFGAIGLLSKLSCVNIEPLLEQLVVLIKSCRPHEHASLALRLAEAFEIPGASLEIIRRIQRCWGYGQRMDEKDIQYYFGLQHILTSITKHKRMNSCAHNKKDRPRTFINFDDDPFQQKVELFKTLSDVYKKRKIRPILKKFGIHHNRYYTLKNRYMLYGIWGLIDLIQATKIGEKISPELELNIIEQRLMDPKLSTNKIIKKLDLKCSKSNVQKTYAKWKLSRFKKPISIRGVISRGVPEKIEKEFPSIESSARSRFPDLIETNNLKVNRSFSDLVKYLSYHKIIINNPGAIIVSPFLNQLGVVEALHSYGPDVYRGREITNNIIVNVLRIIAGFPTINDFTLNSDKSVSIGAGLSMNPRKSRYYDSLDDLRFNHLQKLRNDASCRARELGLIEGKEIAIDYHCDRSDSHFPLDKSLSKSPDKNGDMVYAHRPQILWDSVKNTIINIAYCEGASRAPTALYKFCEENLFKIIDPDVVEEIYADSEYTGEKQLIYLIIRSETEITMCLKQNPKIRKWRDEVIKKDEWESYGKKYRIVSKDFKLAETGKLFRFIVKQEIETNAIRCFGSTHIDYSPQKILDYYHIRWPVETGIKNLIGDYYLNKPTGTSPEKVETHYYCVMLARLTIDYFLSVLCEPKWKTSQDWSCVLSTIRTTIFSSQNCELSLDEAGDLQIIYLDGDNFGIKNNLAKVLEKRKKIGVNKVSWWGGRGVKIKIKNQYDF